MEVIEFKEYPIFLRPGEDPLGNAGISSLDREGDQEPASARRHQTAGFSMMKT